uniref:Energy transducer TonB n=1 Tax=candidate division WOR-3 bacterium TaxID=2052148 RepID=A0A7V1EHL8_UNCW3
MRDHKKMYGIYLRASFLIAIGLIIAFLLTLPYAEPEPYKLKQEVVGIINEISMEIDKQIEPIDNTVRPKPQPAVIAGQNPDDGATTIDPTDYGENIIPTAPIGPDIEVIPYYKVEVKPQPISMPSPVYPPLAAKAGIEGKVVVKMLVDIDGGVIAVEVIKSSGNPMLDDSAIAAAKQSKFTPAKQRDKLVRVWVVRQIEFKLADG